MMGSRSVLGVRGLVAAPALRALAEEMAASLLIFSDWPTLGADLVGSLELGSSADFAEALDFDLDLPEEVVLALLAFFGLAFDAEALVVDARLGLAFDVPALDFLTAPTLGDLSADFAGAFFTGDFVAGFLAEDFLAEVFAAVFLAGALCTADFLVVAEASVFLEGVFVARLDFVEAEGFFLDVVAWVDAVDFFALLFAAGFIVAAFAAVFGALGLVARTEVLAREGVFLAVVFFDDATGAVFATLASSSEANT